MTGIGMLALEFATLITASLHCADTGRQATLVPCGLVTVDDLLAHERVDDRDGLVVAALGRLFVAADEGRRHVPPRGSRARAQRHIARPRLLCLPGGLFGGRGPGQA